MACFSETTAKEGDDILPQRHAQRVQNRHVRIKFKEDTSDQRELESLVLIGGGRRVKHCWFNIVVLKLQMLLLPAQL